MGWNHLKELNINKNRQKREFLKVKSKKKDKVEIKKRIEKNEALERGN